MSGHTPGPWRTVTGHFISAGDPLDPKFIASMWDVGLWEGQCQKPARMQPHRHVRGFNRLRPTIREDRNVDTKHTPTPWKTNGNVQIVTAPHADLDVADCITEGDRINASPEQMANAAFIVRACNAHEELLRLLYNYRDLLIAHSFKDEAEEVEDAIAKAEGQQ